MFEFLEPVLVALKSFLMFFKPLVDFIVATKVPEQIDNIDYKGLFSNAWFLVPYIALLAWNVYKQALNSLIIIVLLTASWAFFGTPYMEEIISRDEVPLEAVLPIVGGACVVLGYIVYRIFLKSD
ncbi:MAG: hypothetical protein RQ753_01570 [Desulfurivibrionaceae bacterium]|nr:hypothetical protein [Desulfurivibrionaceae bacterium]